MKIEDPFREFAIKAYVDYSKSRVKTKIMKREVLKCPVCFTEFQYSHLDYHGISAKHKMYLDLLRSTTRPSGCTL